jgi:hypothetical protein
MNVQNVEQQKFQFWESWEKVSFGCNPYEDSQSIL